MLKKNIRRVLVVLFIIIFAVTVYINTRGDYLEYKELGENYISIFRTNLKYKYCVMGINFIFLYIVLYFAGKGIKKGLKAFFKEEKKELPKLPNKSIALITSAIVSVVISMIFTPKVILYISNVAFEQADSVFNLDVSFYMFMEPLLKMILIYGICIYAGLALYSAMYYIIVFNIYFDGISRETLRKSYLIKHIIRYIRYVSIIFAIFTLIRTVDIVFDKFITTESGIELTGAGMTDVTIRIIGNIIFSIIIVVVVFKATINWKNDNKQKIVRNLLVIPGYMVAMFIVMLGFDLIFVNPNEFDKERNYIEKNISSTRTAYGIDCEDETLQYSGTINEEEVKKNQNILNNTAYVSKDVVLQNLKESQTETGYYTYNNASLLNYNIDGKNTLVYVSPREISSNQRTYNSKTYEYTHGHGLIFTSATSVTEDGNVKYIQNNSTGKEEKIKITNPQIYYGLETQDTVVTQANSRIEYDYTDNKGKEYSTAYQGKSGLNLKWNDRFILGIKKGDMKLAFSNKVTNESKILINRNIIQRAKKVLPNVIYDQNPYTVVDENGDIYWVLDAYTKSNKYPYSTYTNIEYNGEREKINYIRNSIKVIINAYDGSMRFYITDRTDPIAMAYWKIYPQLFEDIESKIPESISSKFVYPKFLYDVQTTMVEEYHNIKADVLYRSDDTWRRTTYNTTQNSKATGTILKSYYTMINDNNTEKVGLIQMFTQKDKQNLTSYLIGTVDNGVSKLKLYKMSSDSGILGPMQLDTQIAQDQIIQKEINSLNVTGAKITKNMIIVPINNTLLYVEPIYQTRTNESDIPVLKKVIVASGNKVAIGDNLKNALESLISQDATSIDTSNTENVNDLIQSIIKSNKNLKTSMESSDWELIGTDINRLQELISLLEKQVEKEEKEKSKSKTKTETNNNVNENVVTNIAQ